MEHRYSYDCVVTHEDDGYIVTFPQFPDVFTEGDTREEAISNAADALTLALADAFDRGVPLPAYRRSAEVVNLSVVMTEEDVAEAACMTFSQAAEHLGVTPSRITALVKSGTLVVRSVKGRRMVTIASVEAYRAAGRKPGRPRRAM